jgi:cytochrome c556
MRAGPRIVNAVLVISLACAGISSAQTVRTARLMREKLQHSQRVFAALVTSDYGLLQRETQALSAITQNPVWSESMGRELRPFTGAFSRALAELSAASERHDSDAAAAAYSSMTSACIECHKHVMKSRVASGP